MSYHNEDTIEIVTVRSMTVDGILNGETRIDAENASEAFNAYMEEAYEGIHGPAVGTVVQIIDSDDNVVAEEIVQG